MSQALSFQRMILKLLDFWADQGCLIWQPYNIQVGAGTMNPATVLRVLGPEPWNVAYIEPSVRPDDGRFGDNPNRMQLHYQLQVILQPDPGKPQELYLQSLEAIGIDPQKHDIRFVEDNWASPALGAWGLGWEVWLDGQEITQFTYFQQAGGYDLDPVAVEMTYGLERILIALQGKESVWKLDWGAGISYGDVLLQSEIEHCKYYFDIADVDALRQIYDTYEAEAQRALEAGLIIPAHDYNLKCSHLFNVLDTRGAVGVTERATYFHRMREMARQISGAYMEQRQRMEYPFLKQWPDQGEKTRVEGPLATFPRFAAPFLLEIGTEELPAGDLDSALEQLERAVPQVLKEQRLAHQAIQILGTPRRLVVLVQELASMQGDLVQEVQGPPADRAFDADGKPTKAALGFARRHNLPVEALQIQDKGKRRYVVAQVRQAGRSAAQVLGEALPELIAQIRFGKSMRWKEGNPVSFSRPIRWLVALLDDQVLRFEYAGLLSGRTSRGLRPDGSPEFEIRSAGDYLAQISAAGIMVQPEARSARIREGADRLAAEMGGRAAYLPGLLEEVTNLVEKPTPLIGSFDESYLSLPQEVLVSVMRKHQRYFPVMKAGGQQLLPLFIAVRNGGSEHLDIVREGNEHVIGARFADAQFFFQKDLGKSLESFLPKLDTLTFETQLGSMLDKTKRLEKLAPTVGKMLGLDERETEILARAAALAKADLASSMVVEMTSLQGIMGQEYARMSGETEPVARAIGEHYLPRSRGDALPQTRPGLALGLADRLDSLMGLFAVGLAPTSSADPYGLRRAALGVVQTLIGTEHSFGLTAGLQAAADLLPVEVTEEMVVDAYEFIVGRLRVLLRQENFGHDVVEAVLAERGDDPSAAYHAVKQLSSWVDREDWEELLHAYGRCKRMARRYEQLYGLDLESFVEFSAQELGRSYLSAAAKVTPGSSVDEFMVAAGSLIAPINTFFDSVLVDDDEHPELRDNRRSLIQHIAELADGILDFSRLEGF